MATRSPSFALSPAADRLLGVMRRWERQPEGQPGLHKPAPECVTTEVLSDRLSLTVRGTQQKIREAVNHKLLAFDVVHSSWQLTAAGRQYLDGTRGGRR